MPGGGRIGGDGQVSYLSRGAFFTFHLTQSPMPPQEPQPDPANVDAPWDDAPGNGDPNAASGSPNAASGSSNAASGSPNAASGSSNAASGASYAASGGLDEDASGDRGAMPVAGESPPRLAFPVVGVGASAGGLEAYTELLQAVPPDSGMAFVLIQHLPPTRESLLVELLSRHTQMPVAQVEDGMAVEANHVYVIRPGHILTIKDGHLHLGEALSRPGSNRPVDDFFRSLAEEQRERAIAIILSGMGSNGTSGAREVKAVGGLCIAQEPDTAKFPSMPRSLIDSGLADFVLRPEEMPEVLSRYAHHPYAAGKVDPEAVARRERQSVAEILAVLRTRTNHDFSGYKKPTLVRRIQRRMGLGQYEKMGEYARSLRQRPGEVQALADDLMIHVTGFFRDPEVWETLRVKVIDPLVAERASDTAIRAWITACSSGEEAYTLGILLLEAAERAGKHFDIKVFATDTAERSLAQARAGVFPGGIATQITPERLERFFEADDSTFRVKKELRELVVFAPQNVLQDPPFSKLDICTCRNLLIYLEPEAQRRVLALLHFGIREGGALLLGTSETISTLDDLFEPIDKKWRLYRRVGPTRHGNVEFPAPHALRQLVGKVGHNGNGNGRAHGEAATNGAMAPRASLGQQADRLLLERFTPPTVVIGRAGQVVYFHGDTDRFLAQPRGEPTRELLSLARDSVRGAVRSAMQKALRGEEQCVTPDGLHVDPDGRRYRVEIAVVPLEPRRGGAGHFLVSFTERAEVPPAEPLPTPGEQESADLRDDLVRAREELQSTVEELQTSNEELKASNEEITSINEELQSSNEELETSKEELQSLNEELTTVNSQLQTKMEELERATNDLTSLLQSTTIAVVFLDTQYRIRRFTPAVKDLLDLIPSDIGRPMSDLAKKFDDPHLLADAEAVLDKLVPVEREVRSEGGKWYVRRVLVYRTADNRIDGVVVTFVDITERRLATERLRQSEALHHALLTNLPNSAAFVVDRDLRYRLAEGQALLSDGLRPGDFEGKTVREALPAELAESHETMFRQALAGEAFRHEHHERGRDFISHGVPLRLDGEDAYAALAVSYDITDRKRGEEALRRSAARDAFRVTLTDVLRPLDEAENVQREACRVLGEHLGANRVHYARVVEGTLFFVTSNYLDGVASMAGEHDLRRFGSVYLGGLRAGETVVVADVGGDGRLTPAEKGAWRDYGVGSFVSVPLPDGGAFVALFCVHCAEPRAWDAEEVALIEEAAQRTREALVRAELLQSERAARATAEAANAAKDDFLANVSHELRTPLSAILLWAKMLLHNEASKEPPPEPEEYREGLEAIDRSARAQQALVDDLLDTTRIAAGKLRLELREADLTGVVADATDAIRPAAAAKDLRLDTDFDADVGLVRVDAERLQQVVWNLLSNAVKFTPAGGRVTVALRRLDHHVEVRVTDTGDGIDGASLDKLFDRFVQLADAGISGARSGLGLGLRICRQIVELHGGTILAESDGPGRGATFVVVLPLRRLTAEPAE